MIPYDEIIETADRSWTLRLLARLTARDLDDQELARVTEALRRLSDHRSFAPLETILVDRNRPERVRIAAGAILRGLQYVAPEHPLEKVLRWWQKGDPVLQRHALRCMDGLRCPDVVRSVAREPTHSLQAIALGQMDFWFDRPQDQQILIAALSHADPAVREAAAYTLLWEEPVAAEEALILATRDPVVTVVAEAVNTLEYYPTQRSLRCLHGLLADPNARIRAKAQESFDALCHSMLHHLNSRHPEVARHIQRWLEPVWPLLGFTNDDLQPDEYEPAPARPRQAPATMDLTGLLTLLGDPDASPRVLNDQLVENGWQGYNAEERRLIWPVLCNHPDQWVRDHAGRVAAAWQDVPGLLRLIQDTDFLVRKTTMYHLGTVPPVPEIADQIWEHLQQPGTLGTHACETLATYVHHADPAAAVPRLATLAADPERGEWLRHAAVDDLADLVAGEEITRLIPLLAELPAVTWALHIAILNAIERLGLPRPDLAHLRTVDNLDLQVALAAFDTDR
jgi:hypothetical protein